MSYFFLPDPFDSYTAPRCSLDPVERPSFVRWLMIRVFNIALAGLLAYTVAGSAACAVRLVLSH